MRTLKELELKNIELFELGEISKAELNSIVTPFNAQDFKNILYNLKGREDSSDLFETLFWFAPTEISEEEKERVYQFFVLENWHCEHEEIVSSFQVSYNNNEGNIPILLQSINTIPDYLIPDDFKYPYIRKIIYAIGAQPEPYNVEALNKLVSETDDEQIKDLASHQIKKRKELGRWEAAKNVQ